MTGDDELRARLTRIDPMRAGGTADSLPSPTASEIQERAMQTTMESAAAERPDSEPGNVRWRNPRVLTAAAAAVLVIGAGAVFAAVATSGYEPGHSTADPPTTLALSLPDTGVASSCVAFDVAFLREMPVAFAGTVTDVTEEGVTLDVDHWYKGGSAEFVAVDLAPGQTSAALDGVEFTEGGRYLVTSTDGTVNGCGFSGPASAELERAFGEAFSG
jgi:hypothetical protein